jgi:type I restriction enzyme S subunit
MAIPAIGAAPAIDIDPRDWADVQRILQVHVPQLEVWAFGSRVKHTAKPFSDLDLALITRQPLSLEQLAAITDAFATSDLPIRVDVVDWASTSQAFRQIIAQDKVVVQSARC